MRIPKINMAVGKRRRSSMRRVKIISLSWKWNRFRRARASYVAYPKQQKVAISLGCKNARKTVPRAITYHQIQLDFVDCYPRLILLVQNRALYIVILWSTWIPVLDRFRNCYRNLTTSHYQLFVNGNCEGGARTTEGQVDGLKDSELR